MSAEGAGNPGLGSNRIEDLDPNLQYYVQYFVDWMNYAGAPVRIVSTLRSQEEQARLYAQGRTTPGPIVTNAPPGTTYHEYGRAFDIAFVGYGNSPPDPSWWDYAGAVGKALGFRWGGDFHTIKDRPHFEI